MREPSNNLKVFDLPDVITGNGQSSPKIMFPGASFGLGIDSVNACRGDLNELSLIGQCPDTPNQ